MGATIYFVRERASTLEGKDNIQMDISEIRFENVDLIVVDQDLLCDQRVRYVTEYSDRCPFL